MPVPSNTTSANAGWSTQLSFAHTTSGSDKLLLVGIILSGAGRTITSVTHNSNTLIELFTQIQGGLTVAAYYMLAPDVSGNVVINVDAAGRIVGIANSFTDVAQSSTFGTVQYYTEPNSSAVGIDIDLISDADELCFDICGKQDNTYTMGAGQTARGSDSYGGTTGKCSSKAGASSVNMSWSFSAWTGDTIQIGVPIKPASTLLPIILTDTAALAPVISSVLPGSETGASIDQSSLVNTIASILAGSGTGIASEQGNLVNVLGTPLPGIEQGISIDQSSLVDVISSGLAGADTGIANDTCSLVSSIMTPLTGLDTGILTDVAALVSVSASTLTGTTGNAITDTAQLASAIASILTAQGQALVNETGQLAQSSVVILPGAETGTGDDQASLSSALVTILTSQETASALDTAILVNAKGEPIAVVETIGITDIAELTSISATILTAGTSTGQEINAIYGTPVIVPVLQGTVTLINKLIGTPQIKE